MMSDASEAKPDTPQRPAGAGTWRVALLLVVVTAGVVALWLQASRWSAGPAGPGPRRLPSDGRYAGAPPSTAPAAPFARPDEALAGAGATAEPEPLADLPEDLPMPAGARRRSLMAYRPLGQRQIKAEYLAAGSVESVAELMGRRLAEAGWQPVPLPGQAAPTGEAVFRKSNDVLSLHLRGEGDWVNIVAVINRVATAGPDGP